jgi:hypothetical protein
MNYSPDTAAATASIGARLLDRYDPNWYEHIDIDTLNMYRGQYCVIGQLYMPGTHVFAYEEALSALFLDPKWYNPIALLADEEKTLYQALSDEEHTYPVAFLGFDVPFGEDEDDVDQHYAWLKDAWIAEIDFRREHDGRRSAVPA